MEIWFTILLAGCLAALVKASLDLFISSKSKKRTLPPGPRAVPLIGRALWLLKSFSELEPILRSLRSQFGPIVTLPVGPRPAIIVSSRTLAHQALVHMGAVFADRPKPLPTARIVDRNQHNISSASYGPNWRLLRRNLTSEILHPSRVKSYSPARKWVLDILLRRFREDSTAAAGGAGVKVMDHFQFAMFCLLVVMCFGDKLDESQIRDIETAQRRLLVSFSRFQILDFWPWLTKIVLRRRWEELLELTNNQEEVLVPLIRARKQVHAIRSGKPNGNSSSHGSEDEALLCYVDTLMELELEEEDGNRKMTELEMVSVCSEFLDAGTDTTSTALQWIMANLVKYPSIQEKLYEEIKGVVGSGEEEVTEEQLCRMPYLKAVILERLRRHPPGHFVLPHAVTREVELGGYTVPKNAAINFMAAEMGWDPEEWEDPMEFKPERFLMGKQGEVVVVEFDVTGSREIKMMPFGAGRRICPGSALAVLHLEYFVANLVWNFQWKAVEGDDVDLSEKQEFTIVMKTSTPRSPFSQTEINVMIQFPHTNKRCYLGLGCLPPQGLGLLQRCKHVHTKENCRKMTSNIT